MSNQQKKHFIFLILLFILLLYLLFISGPVKISLSQIVDCLLMGHYENEVFYNIFWQLRFPKTIAAILAGSGLAISGVLMQTYFQNPLAGPFVLGVNSGASLGVAFWIMVVKYLSFIPDEVNLYGTHFAAILGSFFILFVLVILSIKFSGKIVLLVMGLMFAHLSGGIINILVVLSDSDEIKTFLLWTLGSFSRVEESSLFLFFVIICLGILGAFLIVRPLNILLLGDRYAQSMGVSLKKIKFVLIFLTAILSGTVTAFCGPIAFIGVVVPHIARTVMKTNNHKILLPTVILIGSCLAMITEFFSSGIGELSFPINATLGIIGAPIIGVFLWGRRKMENS